MSWWRRVLRAAAVGLALWRLVSDWSASLSALGHPYHPSPGFRLTDSGFAIVVRDYGTSALVVLVAGALLWAADGSAALGLRLRRRDIPTAMRATQAAAMALLVGAAGSAVALVLRDVVPALGNATSTLSFATGGIPPWWFTVAAPIAVAVSEEVMLLVVLFRALEWVRLPDGRTLAGSAAGIALLAVARCGYHLYEGIGVLSVIGPAVLFPLAYRRYRLIVPIIAVDALTDIAGLLPTIARLPVLLPVVWAAVMWRRREHRQADHTGTVVGRPDQPHDPGNTR